MNFPFKLYSIFTIQHSLILGLIFLGKTDLDSYFELSDRKQRRQHRVLTETVYALLWWLVGAWRKSLSSIHGWIDFALRLNLKRKCFNKVI